jgi:hypothetical protein
MTTRPEGYTRGTTRKTWAWALVLALGTCGRAIGGDGGPADAGHAHSLPRFGPVGGWHPDGCGLVHWWPHQCFPRCGGPDDYCRKPPPRVCWPPYPPFYVWPSSPVVGPCHHASGACDGKHG